MRGAVILKTIPLEKLKRQKYIRDVIKATFSSIKS